MNYLQSNNLYKTLLIQAGVHTKRSEEASQSITFNNMRLISEIWPNWQAVFPYTVNPNKQK
jgi:hypothetical protein